jgi:hypothetical protein
MLFHLNQNLRSLYGNVAKTIIHALNFKFVRGFVPVIHLHKNHMLHQYLEAFQ